MSDERECDELFDLNISVTILDLLTGKTVSCNDRDTYFWTVGNGSCDCNRRHYFDIQSGDCECKRFIIVSANPIITHHSFQDFNSDYVEILDKWREWKGVNS